MKKISEVGAQPSPAELRKWREGYRHYLEAKGLTPDQAADMAAKVAYRPDQYPTDSATTLPLFQLTAPPAAPAPTTQSKAEASPVADTRPAKAKPTRTPKAETPAPEVIPPKPKIKPLTSSEEKLIMTAAEIASTLPSGEDMVFTHAVLCQVGLPRAKVDGREFMRQSGQAWINVQAGWLDEGKGPVQQPIPYGVMPRLALAWVSTYAVRHGTREIPIGDSAAEFLRLMLGADTASQGARYTTLRKQMHALAACRLQLGFRGRTFNGQAVEQFDAWVSNRESNQKPLWPGVMTLSEHYFNELRDSAVPLDNRALHALKGSALALDVYAWLAHRLHRIEGRGVVLHWKALREQFAQEYKGKDPDKDFKKEFLPVLRKVQAVYPSANVKQVTGGLLLLGSPPPVPKKLTK